MSLLSMVSYGPSQTLHPLSLLAQLTGRFSSGCLQVSDGSTSWLIYLEQGRLAFATNSTDPFERLDRHLRQLSRQVPTLVSAVRVQVRLLFESVPESHSLPNPDYQAICWLVEQKYLERNEVTFLINSLAKEVIESFLAITEGSYEFIEKASFDNYPEFCQLDLRPLVEYCQNQLKRRQTSAKPALPSLLRSETLEQRNTQRFREAEPSRKLSQFISTPVTETNSSKPEKSDKSKAKAASELPLKGQYTVACIDDSPTILQVIKSFLDDASFTVVMINDPIKALMQVIRNKPDIILLDVGMPNLDGYELCSLLRRHANFKETPIIMVTGNTGFIDRAKAKLVGASGYLTKPFTQSELLKIVFKHLV